MKRLALAAAIVLVAGASASAKTWTVGAAGADFPLIAPALAAAADGDVIRVGPGVYREALVIHRSVTIFGEGAPVLYGLGTGSVIRVFAPGTQIRGLVIEGSGAGETNEMDAAIQVASGGNLIAGNTMRRVFYGIVVAGGTNNEIAGNEIAGFVDLPFGKRGDGIYVYRAAGTRVVRNRVTGQRDGIYFQYAPGGLAEENLVQASRYGLHVMFANGIVIRGNTFRQSSVGANIMDSRSIEIVANRFERNRGVSAIGLTLKQCDDSIIRDNVVVGNARGIQVDGASSNRFAGNRLAYNDTAVMMFASAERNVFTANVFEGNWSDVVITGGGAQTSWSDNDRGNTWADYNGFDFDDDGIGDTPHPLLTPFAAIEGANPIARLFLQSPAAAGLALAARAGLTLDRTEHDSAPIVVSAPESHGGSLSGIAVVTLALVFAFARVVSSC